jgi:hypothetical protein
MDCRLEVLTLPVSDVDQACGFYAQAGFALDVDYHPASHFRVVQLTPPGSACSVQIGAGLTDAAPGSARATCLAVTDIEAAHRELTGRGVKVSDIRRKSRSTAGPAAGSRVPTRSTATTPAWPTSPIQTATPGSSRKSATASRTPPAVSPGRCDDRFDQVTRCYTDGTVAVSGLNLKAATGEITVLVAPSGCGKRQTLRMVNRTIDPSRGGSGSTAGTPPRSGQTSCAAVSAA